MEMLTAEHMQAISDEKKRNKKALKSLLQTPFDTLNSDQMQKFKQRLDHFEFSLNRSRIINSMTSLLTVWGSSWLWAVVLPTPDFAEILLNYALYVGLAGLTLRSFSMNAFHEELEEIRNELKHSRSPTAVVGAHPEHRPGEEFSLEPDRDNREY